MGMLDAILGEDHSTSRDHEIEIRDMIIDNVAKTGSIKAAEIADYWGYSSGTIYRYMNELLEEKVIERIQRDSYRLYINKWEYGFDRIDGHFFPEDIIFQKTFAKLFEWKPSENLNSWRYAVDEMLNNVAEHSEADELRIEILYSCLDTMVILRDNGIGIFEKLQHNYPDKTIEEIKEELMNGELASTNEKHLGKGIFFTSKIMDYFRIQSGGIYISTSDASCGTPQFRGMSRSETSAKGTVVKMTLLNRSNTPASEIFTKLPVTQWYNGQITVSVKEKVGENPVSRSQAVELCNTFCGYAEVLIDFSEVERVSPSFIHQIFIVFQREHPRMKIEPINMVYPINRIYLLAVNM